MQLGVPLIFPDLTTQSTAATANATSIQGQPTAEFPLTDAATVAVNWNNGLAQRVLTIAARTFTLANGIDGRTYVLRITNGATGGLLHTLPAITWVGGPAPSFSTLGANKLIIITLFRSGGIYVGNFAMEA